MAKRKRIGRPPKPAKNRKSVNFTFRSREGMREQLRVAAGLSGRSISEEIEYRLVQSFRDEYIAEVAAHAALRMLEEREVFKAALKPTEEEK
jgi:Arc-like DNA binding domain